MRSLRDLQRQFDGERGDPQSAERRVRRQATVHRSHPTPRSYFALCRAVQDLIRAQGGRLNQSTRHWVCPRA